MSDGFLGRWSRRKLDVKQGKPVEAEPPAPAPAPTVIIPEAGIHPHSDASHVDSRLHGNDEPVGVDEERPPPPTLEDVRALTPESDFSRFTASDVAPEVKNAAMKKLFADPHFNVMDGLDVYIDDYTQPDPLPEGMLRKMASAHAMGFFDHEKKADAAPDVPVNGAAVEASADAEAIAPALAQPRDDAEGHAPADVAQSGVCNAIPSAPSSELEMAARPHKDAVALPASHIEHDHDAHLRLQPDDAPQREGVGRGAA